jgi:antitoxin PrlF
MQAAQVTSKGQITIPVDVRRALQVSEGDRVQFVQIAPGRFEFMAATRDVRELKGMFGPVKAPVSIAQMNAAIAARGASAG